jgi:hypothetical protein
LGEPVSPLAGLYDFVQFWQAGSFSCIGVSPGGRVAERGKKKARWQKMPGGPEITYLKFILRCL